MKLISWNVNGIRAVLKKGFLSFLEKEKPDVLCLQEVKAEREQLEFNPIDYEVYWNSAVKKGYSGTAIFSKINPQNTSTGISIDNKIPEALSKTTLPENNNEGRVLTAEYENFYLVNVYTPNSKPELERLEFRTQYWDITFLEYIKYLEKNKPVIICGDLNVAHKEIDLARPKQNTKTAGFTKEERNGMDNYINHGLIDTFRFLYPDKTDSYTWWSYFGNARKNNIGWRIDYFLVSNSLKNAITNVGIYPEVTGSDHCPVLLEIDLSKIKKYL